MRDHSWIRQTSSDAWESMNLEDWFGDPGHVMTRSHAMIAETKLAKRQQTVIPELKLTKRVKADEEGTRFMRPRIVVEKLREIERRRISVVSTDIEARGHMRSCPGYALLTSQGVATRFRERIGTTMRQEGNMRGQSR